MITQRSSIGFIGLGAMGQRMARRLLGSGFRLIAYDHTSSKTKELVASGAISAPSLQELAKKSEVVISCLPNDEAVLSVYQGSDGVLAWVKPGAIVIEMSTVSPETSRALHLLAKRGGLKFWMWPFRVARLSLSRER